MSTDCVSKTEENLPPSSLHVQTTITIIEVFAQSLARMSSVRSVALFSFAYKPARVAVDLSARLYQTLGSTSIAI